jgi:hypothetical protein
VVRGWGVVRARPRGPRGKGHRPHPRRVVGVAADPMSTPGRDVWITTADAVRLTGRKASTIRKWVARGHLVPRTVRGKQRLEAAAVLDVERETRRRARAGRPRGSGAA